MSGMGLSLNSRWIPLGCRKAIAEIKKMVVEGPSVDIDDAVGFTLQAGVDVSLGGGWYLNADVKKTWLDTERPGAFSIRAGSMRSARCIPMHQCTRSGITSETAGNAMPAFASTICC